MPSGRPTNPDALSGIPDTVYHFGQFSLDTRERILKHLDDPVHIKPKAFDVLIVLLMHVNKVVSKDELISAVWHDAVVEEANIAVHVSTLRKLFRSRGESSVRIETVPKTGYRLAVENYGEIVSERDEGPKQVTGSIARKWLLAAGLVLIFLSVAGSISLLKLRKREVDPYTWKSFSCAGTVEGNFDEPGGCDDPVLSFSAELNPKGNWLYGSTPQDDFRSFSKFSVIDRNSYFEAVPGIPINIWRNQEQWQPSIMKNTSNEVILPQGAFSLPPDMLNLHPGPNCERSVVRWTAPKAGIFKLEGAFWGIDIHHTSSDFQIVQNGILQLTSGEINGYGYERRFVQTPQVVAGDTIDFSVGCGLEGYKSDSTGLRLTVTKTDPWQ